MDVRHANGRVVTHRLRVDHEQQVVVKRYPENTRGEAAREWRALRLLAEHAPRLAPEPVSAELDASPPSIVMSLLPGEPLGARPLAQPQERALAVAIGRLWQSVPVGLVTPVDGERGAQAELERMVRGWAAAAADAADPLVRAALNQGTGWLAGADLPGPDPRVIPQVLGHGDASLTNFLWDGELVRILDFEDSGVSDRAFELAVLVEHVSAWRDSELDAERFAGGFDLSLAERAKLAAWRRMAALYWLLRLHEGGEQDELRPQAERLLSVL